MIISMRHPYISWHLTIGVLIFGEPAGFIAGGAVGRTVIGWFLLRSIGIRCLLFQRRGKGNGCRPWQHWVS